MREETGRVERVGGGLSQVSLGPPPSQLSKQLRGAAGQQRVRAVCHIS